MTDTQWALVVAGAGYGITILVLFVISVIIRGITLIVRKTNIEGL
jgi:hypothetical protein